MDFIDCKFYSSQYVIDERGERKSPKHSNCSLLLFDSSLVFWNRILLYV